MTTEEYKTIDDIELIKQLIRFAICKSEAFSAVFGERPIPDIVIDAELETHGAIAEARRRWNIPEPPIGEI